MSMQMLIGSVSSVAATSELPRESTTVTTLASMIGGLILVLLLIFMLAYIVRRFNLVPSSQGVLKTLAVSPLGQREKLVLVEVDGQQYLLGVTAHQVNLIDKLTTAVAIPTDSFSSRLRQAKSTQL